MGKKLGFSAVRYIISEYLERIGNTVYKQSEGSELKELKIEFHQLGSKFTWNHKNFEPFSALDAGLNTVETYVAWNLHEKVPGVFDFSDNLDLVEFIKIAGKMGLHVICRPGPYICSEWEWECVKNWKSKRFNFES